MGSAPPAPRDYTFVLHFASTMRKKSLRCSFRSLTSATRAHPNDTSPKTGKSECSTGQRNSQTASNTLVGVPAISTCFEVSKTALRHLSPHASRPSKLFPLSKGRTPVTCEILILSVRRVNPDWHTLLVKRTRKGSTSTTVI